MDSLKLVALDPEDLKIVSAHVQDAVVKSAELDYRAGEKRFLMPMNRFAWEVPRGFFRRRNERRRSLLHFERVLSVQTTGISRDRQDEVLELLAILFEEAEAPAGVIELTFAGGAAARLQVECIEARLADLGAAWAARSRPQHRA
jgi:hypothetical protein